ncbi:MAG: tRNA (N(6)-L-threonylcarbamoyladenosine(37)-C(2))-methylthiotransferase MtaB [Chitinophagales bacterium]|nr:tRNA (N(6)-L-threonylcarbamoyladenosine(37)-C(2))-methylthiotransferase MtaB [Bacteroidota bacterium]MCB9257135.1 tRNA (N(6)-L-threonylcarbamoyladenosine(37)-C(2))-methylthiotransferase MtaB [Chitinophagales bacterium]
MYYNRRVAYYTLGCKLNFSETSAISRSLQDNGYTKVDFSELADFYVVNTCSVTENADKKCKQIVKQAKKTNPDAKVIIIGCYAQLKPEEIASIKGVDLVLGANEKFKLHEHLENIEELSNKKLIAGAIKEVSFYSEAYSFGERTRSFVKVQDGCDYFCSFCTIPLARGRSRSASVEKTLALVEEVAKTKVKEIVLTGVNIGDFGKSEDGKKRGSENFYQLIQALDKVSGIERFRISSIEPNLLRSNIIEFVAKSNHFVPHFHIPLQSGSDLLLQKMRRKYDTSLYRKRIEKIKSLMPHCCIGVDVIVGFPGESDEEFAKTLDFLKELDVSYLHVFTYSERANTKAVLMGEVVPLEKRRERSKILRILSEKKKRAFYSQFIGTEQNVLLEAENEEDRMFGFTENYIKVSLPYNEDLVNTIQRVRLDEISNSGVVKASLVLNESWV